MNSNVLHSFAFKIGRNILQRRIKLLLIICQSTDDVCPEKINFLVVNFIWTKSHND